MRLLKTLGLRQPRILIITGGKVEKISPFREAAEALSLNLTLASFSDLNYVGRGKKFVLRLADTDLRKYDLIYIRMVGKRLEEVSLLANYAVTHHLKLVDSVYKNEHLFPSSIAKSIETRKLLQAGIVMPKTIYGSLEWIRGAVKKTLQYPFILKSTSGRKAREVWLINSEEDIGRRVKELQESEKLGIRYFGQEYIQASQRTRALVVGDKVIGAITRPTKWNKKENPEKSQVFLTKEDINLAVEAAKASDLEICGVDILHSDKTGKSYLIEANAAPSWKLIAKDCGINVEQQILKYLCKV